MKQLFNMVIHTVIPNLHTTQGGASSMAEMAVCCGQKPRVTT